MPSACLLVTHGSRDIRPQIAIAQLAHRVQQKLSGIVGTAVLECAPLPLHAQIEQFIEQHHLSSLQIVPLFLLPGVHVMEDIPEQVAIAEQHVQATLKLTPYLGSHPGLGRLFANRFSSPAGRILLSHGSRRTDGNAPVEKLAASLGASPAYWSVPPNLETSVQQLIEQGCQQITILPHFLFSGGITDAIAQSVEELSQRSPQVTLQLLAPLDVSDDLVDLVVDLSTANNLSNSVLQ